MKRKELKVALATKRACAAFEKRTGIHFCVNHTGKMAGMVSISTSAADNNVCRERAKVKGSICEHCFAMSMENAYTDLAKLLKMNTDILTTTLFKVEDFPVFDESTDIARIESFGDAQITFNGHVKNSTQCRNYIRLCQRNPHTIFAAWTKSPGFWDLAFKAEHGKPANLIMVLSSPFMNVVANPAKFAWIDKVFTVFDAAYAMENNVQITCGGKECQNCRICYTKTDNVVYVNELLKKEQSIPAAAENALEKIERKLDLWKMRKDAAAYEIDNFNELHADRIEYSNTMDCKVYRFTDPAAADKARRAAENEYSKTCKYLAYWTEKHAAALDYYYKTRRLIAI